MAPLTCTVEPATKLVPPTVRVKPEPPATALTGEIVESDGVGSLTVKLRGELELPPGVETVIDKEPAVERSALVSVVES